MRRDQALRPNHTGTAHGEYTRDVTTTVVSSHSSQDWPRAILLFLLMLAAMPAHAQSPAGDARRGEDIWRSVCQACHGPVPDANSAARTASGIAGAISSITRMSFLQGTLAQQDLEDIAAFVRGDSAPPARPDVNGLWYLPQEAGWGVALFDRSIPPANGRLMALIYIYDEQSRPQWFLLVDAVWPSASTLTTNAYRTAANRADSSFDPARVTVSPAGRCDFAFSSASSGVVDCTIEGKRWQRSIERLRF